MYDFSHTFVVGHHFHQSAPGYEPHITADIMLIRRAILQFATAY